MLRKHEKAEEEYHRAKQCCLYMRRGYNKLYDARLKFVLGQRLGEQIRESNHGDLHFNNTHQIMRTSCWPRGLSL